MFLRVNTVANPRFADKSGEGTLANTKDPGQTKGRFDTEGAKQTDIFQTLSGKTKIGSKLD